MITKKIIGILLLIIAIGGLLAAISFKAGFIIMLQAVAIALVFTGLVVCGINFIMHDD